MEVPGLSSCCPLELVFQGTLPLDMEVLFLGIFLPLFLQRTQGGVNDSHIPVCLHGKAVA